MQGLGGNVPAKAVDGKDGLGIASTSLWLAPSPRLARIAPSKVILPDSADWARAGELAGRVARGIAGTARSIRTAFDRVELIHDALTALAALRAHATLVTSDRDFDHFMQLEPGLDVLFYE